MRSCPPFSPVVTKAAASGLERAAAIAPKAAPAFQGVHAHIGVFDSGLGGLSVLRALRARLPQAALTYVADSGHAPYGEREGEFIVSRSQRICDFLLARQVDAIVVACNTATAAAIHLLRQAHPGVPIVGVEPGVKPAVAQSASKRVGVLATPSTLASDKYRRLIDQHGADATIVAQACPGLAKAIEAGELDSPALRQLVAGFAQPLREAGVDTVVLGCTHYPFVAPLFQQALGPDVAIVDTAEAVAEQTARLVAAKRADADPNSPENATQNHKCASEIHLFSSADPRHLAMVARHWLGIDGHVLPLD